jgi:hypothetical protein
VPRNSYFNFAAFWSQTLASRLNVRVFDVVQVGWQSWHNGRFGPGLPRVSRLVLIIHEIVHAVTVDDHGLKTTPNLI